MFLIIYIFFYINISETGVDKPTIQDYARKVGADEDGDMKYESEFEVPSEFGEIGAILLENEHHTEMYLKDIVLDGLPNGPVNITCDSWLHSKHDNKQKRIFFTNKVSFFTIYLSFVHLHIY